MALIILKSQLYEPALDLLIGFINRVHHNRVHISIIVFVIISILILVQSMILMRLMQD